MGAKSKKKLTQKDIKFKKLLKVFCLFSAVHTSTLWLGVEGVICSIWVLSEGEVRLSITKTVTTMYGNELFSELFKSFLCVEIYCLLCLHCVVKERVYGFLQNFMKSCFQ